MLIYYATTLLGVLIMYYVQRKYKRILLVDQNGIYRCRKKAVYLLPFIPLFLLSALRYGIGTDYFHTYYPTFSRIYRGSKTDFGFELGYYYLNKIVAAFSSDVTWVLAICSFLFFLFVGMAIVQQSDDPAFSLALLFGTGLFTYSMNGVRQALVISVWLFTLRFIKEQKIVPFLICILASLLFHSSAIILVPFYFIMQKKITPSVSIGLVLGTAVFSSVFKNIILRVASYTKYLNKFSGSELLEGNFSYFEFIITVGILILLLTVYRQLNGNWKYDFLLITTTIGLMCSILTKDIYIIARISVFFNYTTVLYLPTTLKAFRGRNIRTIIKIILVLAYFLSLWYMMGYLGKGDHVPYQSIFDR